MHSSREFMGQAGSGRRRASESCRGKAYTGGRGAGGTGR